MDVRLVSTSGHQNLLKQLTKNGQLTNVYLLKTDKPEKIRVGYFNDGFEKSIIISHIDPPGGPRITVGKTIKNTTLPVVERIEFNRVSGKYIIIFEE